MKVQGVSFPLGRCGCGRWEVKMEGEAEMRYLSGFEFEVRQTAELPWHEGVVCIAFQIVGSWDACVMWQSKW